MKKADAHGTGLFLTIKPSLAAVVAAAGSISLRIERQLKEARTYFLRIFLRRRNYAITVRRHEQINIDDNFENDRDTHIDGKRIVIRIERTLWRDGTDHALHFVGHNRGLRHKQNHVFVDGYGGIRLAFRAVCVGVNDLDGNIHGNLNTGAIRAVRQAVDLKRRDIADRRGTARADKRERICRIGGHGIGDRENDVIRLPLFYTGIKDALCLKAYLFVQPGERISVDRPGTFIRLKIGKK